MYVICMIYNSIIYIELHVHIYIYMYYVMGFSWDCNDCCYICICMKRDCNGIAIIP